jgi:hypothetical protein
VTFAFGAILMCPTLENARASDVSLSHYNSLQIWISAP